jgi:hypothetical protein
MISQVQRDMKYLGFLLYLCPLLLPGCGVLDVEEPDLSVSLHSDAPLPRAYTFRVTVDGERFDLRVDSGFVAQADREVGVSREGDLHVTAELLDPMGRLVADTSFTQTYDNDSNHWVSGHIGERRPVGFCIGNVYAVRIDPPVATARADSLFVMVGSIPKDAIC